MYESTCFVVSPIGEVGSDVRMRADRVFEQIVRPAMEQLGLRALRADQIERPGLISLQMLGCLVHAPLVIADATGNNPNVLYEIGVRHALGLPLVQIAEFGSDLPFDIESIRRIEYRVDSADAVAQAIQRIVSQSELMLSPQVSEGFSLHRELGLNFTTVDDLVINAATDLRDLYRSITSSPNESASEIDQMRFLIGFIRRVAADSGHGHYFAGELALLEHDPQRARREFFKYLDRIDQGAVEVTSGIGTQEICYRFSHGYCEQRTGWICHLVAHGFWTDFSHAELPEQKRLYAERVVHYCDRAMQSYPLGFAQLVPTVSLKSGAIDYLS